IILRTPRGKPFAGVSRDLGAPVLNLAEGISTNKLEVRRALRRSLDPPGPGSPAQRSLDHFHELALDMLLNPQVRQAFDLQREPATQRDRYGDHLAGQSM